MKKRTIARMMAAVMAVSMLAGCGDSDGDTAKKVWWILETKPGSD